MNCIACGREIKAGMAFYRMSFINPDRSIGETHSIHLKCVTVGRKI